MTVQILEGDCREKLRNLPERSVRLVVTSPPYNIGKEYEVKTSLDEWEADQDMVTSECVRMLSDGGSLCWQVGNYVNNGEVVPLDSIIIPMLRAAGMTIRNRIVWTFGHGLHCTRRLSGRHETIVWATKGDDYLFNVDTIRVPSKYPNKRHYKGPKKGQLSGNPLGKNPGDVWDISNIKNNHPEKTAHPCQFPEEMVRRLVVSMTQEGDTVLDPYAGSGTVGAVARQEGRRAILIERDPTYAAIARERISADAPLFSANDNNKQDIASAA